MFISFFPNPRAFFTSAAIWGLVAVLAWFFFFGILVGIWDCLIQRLMRRRSSAFKAFGQLRSFGFISILHLSLRFSAGYGAKSRHTLGSTGLCGALP